MKLMNIPLIFLFSSTKVNVRDYSDNHKLMSFHFLFTSWKANRWKLLSVYFPFKSYVANIFYLEIQSHLTNRGHPTHQDEVSEARSKAGGVKSAMTDKWWLPWGWKGWNGNSCAHVPSLFLVFSLTPACPSSPIRYFWSEMNAGILYFPTFHQENLVHC